MTSIPTLTWLPCSYQLQFNFKLKKAPTPLLFGTSGISSFDHGRRSLRVRCVPRNGAKIESGTRSDEGPNENSRVGSNNSSDSTAAAVDDWFGNSDKAGDSQENGIGGLVRVGLASCIFVAGITFAGLAIAKQNSSRPRQDVSPLPQQHEIMVTSEEYIYREAENKNDGESDVVDERNLQNDYYQESKIGMEGDVALSSDSTENVGQKTLAGSDGTSNFTDSQNILVESEFVRIKSESLGDLDMVEQRVISAEIQPKTSDSSTRGIPATAGIILFPAVNDQAHRQALAALPVLKVQKEQIKEQMKALLEQMNEQMKVVDEQQKEARKLKEQFKALYKARKQMEQLKAQVEELKARGEEFEEQKEQMKALHEQIKAGIKPLQEQAKTLEEQTNVQAKLVKVRREQYAALKEQAQALAQQVKALKEQLKAPKENLDKDTGFDEEMDVLRDRVEMVTGNLTHETMANQVVGKSVEVINQLIEKIKLLISAMRQWISGSSK